MPAADVGRPARRAGLAALGEDLDHAAGRFRAVERRRRRALDDLDALDVFGADVVEWERILSRVRHGRRVAAEDAHAVDVDDRVVPLRDAVVAAQLDHDRPRRAARSSPAL